MTIPSRQKKIKLKQQSARGWGANVPKKYNQEFVMIVRIFSQIFRNSGIMKKMSIETNYECVRNTGCRSFVIRTNINLTIFLKLKAFLTSGNIFARNETIISSMSFLLNKTTSATLPLLQMELPKKLPCITTQTHYISFLFCKWDHYFAVIFWTWKKITPPNTTQCLSKMIIQIRMLALFIALPVV